MPSDSLKTQTVFVYMNRIICTEMIYFRTENAAYVRLYVLMLLYVSNFAA